VAAVACTIASLKGFAFRQDMGNSNGGVYFVPDDSLLATDAARLGINGPQDLFGGVVPWRFAMTKAITHELVDSLAKRPKELVEQLRQDCPLSSIAWLHRVFTARSAAGRGASAEARTGPS
jgi:hypothetical protein